MKKFLKSEFSIYGQNKAVICSHTTTSSTPVRVKPQYSNVTTYRAPCMGPGSCSIGPASGLDFLWPPCVADADIIFLPCGFFLYIFLFYSSPNLSRRRLDVHHTSTHGVALVRI